MKKSLSLVLVMLLFAASALALPTTDRAGNELALGEAPQRVISMAPAITQVIESLGLTGTLVGVDSQSPLYVAGLDDLPHFDMMSPDCEAMAALEPDLVLVTGLSFADADDTFSVLRMLGIPIAVIPSSESLDAIAQDIIFIGDVMGEGEKGNEIASDMREKIEEIAAIGQTIEDKKTVMFEISALPYIYSFGTGTFLHEMIELIGATNVHADRAGWLAVTEEAAIAANPDVILTSVTYIDDPVGEIKGRAGWSDVTAIKDDAVYTIDNAKTSIPNQYVVDALYEMAALVYPEFYGANHENVA